MATSTTNIDESLNVHIRPLSWLLGTWKGENGSGYYPTISDFNYHERVSFKPIPNKPIIEYTFVAFKTDGITPLHKETGFIRVKPDTNQIAFVAAHNLGVVEILEGTYDGTQLTVETVEKGRTSFNRPPEVLKTKRTFTLSTIDGKTKLESVLWMETENTEMTEHLKIDLELQNFSLI